MASLRAVFVGGSIFIATALGVAALHAPTSAHAEKPPRTWTFLTTGNGHGFQIFDAKANKITHLLEHPYRYLRPNPFDSRADGVGRRNLAYDFYFGVRGGSGGGWLNEGTLGEPSYLEESNIIRAPISHSGISAETYYFSPFGYEGNALIAVMKAPGATQGFALFNFHLGDGSPDSPNANGESLRTATISGTRVVIETGAGGGATVYVPLSPVERADCDNAYNKVKGGQMLADNTGCRGNDIVPAFQATLTDGAMAVGVLFVSDTAQAEAAATAFLNFTGGKTPDQLLKSALDEWSAWRKPPPEKLALCTDDEKKLYRQSEAVLRMGQVRESLTPTRKNQGMVLASLPMGEWHTGWVRDAMYGIVALARMGHHAEAKLALDFFLGAEPVGKYKSFVQNQDYRISVVRYYGNGEEEADYSGQKTPNVETDGWGMFLWAARQYVDASGDVAWLASKTRRGDTVYDAMVGGIGKPLLANTESSGIAKADSSIWEVHDENKKHFAYTTLSTIRGFCDLAAMGKKAGKDADASAYGAAAQKSKAGFFAVFQDQNGALAGSLEELAMNQYLDAAVVEAFTWNVLTDYTSRTATATMDLLERLRVESGGYKRNDDGLSSYDNNEWIMIDLRMSDALYRIGKEQPALSLQKLLIDKASANFYLLPELYNAVRADGQVGKYAGSVPMVGYGGGAYVLTMMDRSGLVEPNDCGDGKGNANSGRAYSCSNIPSMPGGNGNGGTPTGDELPYEAACLCKIGSAQGQRGGLPRFESLFAALFLFGLGGRSLRRWKQKHRSLCNTEGAV